MILPRWAERFWPVVPIIGALLFIILLLFIFGADPLESLSVMFLKPFENQSKMLSVMAFWVPLTLCALGLLVTFTGGLWNIGVEGQMILGSLGASWIALTVEAPPGVMIFLEIIAAMIAGALWGALTGFLKTHGKVHEIFGGLALNNLANMLALYLIAGPWQPPEGGSFRGTPPFQEAALLPRFAESRFSPLSFVLTILAIGLVFFALNNSFWGLKLKALGKNARSAFLLGVSSKRETIFAMMFCGALAGLGGAVRVLSWFDSLRQNISGGIGYLALLVVMLATFRLILTPFISFFFSVVLNGSLTLQLKTQLHSSVGGILTGVMVLFVLLFGEASKLGFRREENKNE